MTYKIKAAFVGDLSITGVFKDKINNNIEIFDEPIKGILQNKQFIIANLEGPTTDNNNYYRNNGLVVSPLKSIGYLNKRNFNVYNLANNHLFDNGVIGFIDTKSEISKHECFSFGAGETIKEASEVLLLSKNNITLALIGISHKEGMIATNNSPGVFSLEKNFNLLVKKINYARKKADWIILNYHGGEEFSTLPLPRRRRLFHKLAKLNIDIIIGHHSHVVQGYEYILGKPIFYSLGNFVFDIKPHKRKKLVNNGIILNFEFTKNNYKFHFTPTIIDKENGKIMIGDKEFIDIVNKKYSNFSKYWKNWFIDAHQTFYNSENSDLNEDKIGKRHQSILSLFLKKDTLVAFIRLLKSPVKRPLFLGAITYKILSKTGLFFN